MGFRYVGIGFLFMAFCTVFVLGCEKPSKSSSQQTVTEKPPTPANAAPVKLEELTFELVESIKFADGTEVKSIAKADIEALRDQPISMGMNPADGVTLTNHKDEQVHVRTCREYDAALEAGYYPLSTYDISMGSWFKSPCGTLDSLRMATIPQQSFIPTLKEGVVDLELLPVSLFPVLFDFADNIENATYQDCVGKGLLKVTDTGPNWFSCEDEGLRQRLTEMVRADFNGDAIEDILFSEAVHATQGSYRDYWITILTRKSEEGKYEKVELHDSK